MERFYFDLSIDRRGRYFLSANYLGFDFVVSNNGEVLTISNFSIWGFYSPLSDEGVCAYFNGTYSKTSSNPDYNWYD
jgi:hypothetical protein